MLLDVATWIRVLLAILTTSNNVEVLTHRRFQCARLENPRLVLTVYVRAILARCATKIYFCTYFASDDAQL